MRFFEIVGVRKLIYAVSFQLGSVEDNALYNGVRIATEWDMVKSSLKEIVKL